MKVTVCISDSDDERLGRTLRSLARQSLPPDEVLIERHGTVPASRNLMFAKSTGDVLVFLDTDQEAPDGWLQAITVPIVMGYADYTCGPTQPHPNPSQQNRYTKYLAEIERRHYIACNSDPTAYPMGNSAWSRNTLRSVAQDNGGQPFDESFTTGGEDYDVNLHAAKLGFLGEFVSGAWVWHDQSTLNNPLKIMRRKLRYCEAGARAQLKNGHVAQRLTTKRGSLRPYIHPLELFQKVAQAFGLGMALASRH
jgi:glycosyltransferase involved in cell wall biosynthesis